MSSKGTRGVTALLFAALATAAGPAAAQEQVSVVVDRGLTEDLPYTAIYPGELRTADDGNPATILTLQHPDALFQCDVFAVPSTAADWTADAALNEMDIGSTEADWAASFPGFRLVGQSITRFASGPALFYEGVSDNSPFGVPVSLVHAETVDNGMLYIVECLLAQDIAQAARPMADFIIANFSTNSEGECCIDPTDDRG